MKKNILSALVFVLICFGNAAKAGNSTIEPIPNNGKEEVNKSTSKKTATYSFTLFSFFKSTDTAQKADSIKTQKEIVVKEDTINSDL